MGMTRRLLTGYYVPCFGLPRKPLTLMAGICSKGCCKRAAAVKMTLTRVIPATRLCSCPGFMANPELPRTGPRDEAEWRIGVLLK